MSTTLTINTRGLTNGTAPGISVRIDLQNCSNPRVIGSGQIVPLSLSVIPVNGVAVVTLFDNQQITCGTINVQSDCACTVDSQKTSFYSFYFVYQGQATSIGSYNLRPGTFNLWDLAPCIGRDCICADPANDIPIITEEPIGIVNGVNTVFALKFKPSTLWLMQGGVFMTVGTDYTIVDNIITFIAPPTSSLWAIYTFSSCVPNIVSEVPTGAIDGTNRDFTLSQLPNTLAMWVYLSGTYMTYGIDYTVVGKVITFTFAPTTQPYVDYVTGSVNNPFGNITYQVPSGVIDGTNNIFTIAGPNRFIMLQQNQGLLQPGVGFTQSGNTLSLTIAPSIGDVLLATLFN